MMKLQISTLVVYHFLLVKYYFLAPKRTLPFRFGHSVTGALSEQDPWVPRYPLKVGPVLRNRTPWIKLSNETPVERG